ncbi:hypothetical protein V2A60_007973 [Cordyceps javanica]|uniref:RNA exonuclease n=1 Tax=Cordyceps javanica TaxID=43265 RepID=A0A545V978_9HYPO|nr:RNA exonuclease [Cordyceps javanica]TQW09492.1 RNA exonuclease [Cordyceps javanica]
MTTLTSQTSLPEADFGSIPATSEHLDSLQRLTHPQQRLQKAGYVLWQLGPSDLNKKKRCGRCSKAMRKGHDKQKSRAQSVKLAPTIAQQIAAENYLPLSEEQGQASVSAHARSVSLQAGTADISDMMRDYWTCCGNFVSSAPCAAEQFHTTRVYRHGELESNWEYFYTPPRTGSLPGQQKPLAAVVLDCEMGTAASGESELIRVSAVDFFTRRVLVDSLVWPEVRMAHFNTRYSGVSRPSMEAARRAGRTLGGRAGARAALWRFVDPHTIVVGHSANSDLNALRWIHPIVIDTLLLEMHIQPPPPDDHHHHRNRRSRSKNGDTVDDADEHQQPPLASPPPPTPPTGQESPKEDRPKYPGLSLKALAAERLKRRIQIAGQGHDSLEDALATRDLLLWHMIHKPEPPVFASEEKS